MELLNELIKGYKKARNSTWIIVIILLISGILIFTLSNTFIQNLNLIIYKTIYFTSIFSLLVHKYWYLQNWKEANNALKSIETSLVKPGLLSEETYTEIIKDVIERQELVLSFKNKYKIEDLRTIEELDNKKYIKKSDSELEHHKVYLHATKNYASELLSTVFTNKSFWRGRKYFHLINFATFKIRVK